MSERDFIMLKKLGEGSFGQVYKVKRLSDMNQYAMKKVKFIDMKDRDKKNALNQVRLLASIQHQNIIDYKEAFFDQQTKRLCTVMELAENGDLAGKIKQKYRNCENFYEFQIWSIGQGILKGLQKLHENKIIHRDLKPANIFFGENNTAKIGDMNVSILLDKDMAYTQTGTPYYASPEVWNNDPYSYECDVWSFGCMLYEMCTLKTPFRGKDMDMLYEKIQRCQYEKISKRYSPELEEVVSLCLRPRSRRVKINQLVRIFEKFEPPKSNCRVIKKCSTTQNLLKTIKMPESKHDIKELSKVLPKSRYKIEDQIAEPDPEFMRQSSTSLGRREQSISKKSSAPKIKQSYLVGGKAMPLNKRPIALGHNRSVRKVQRVGSSNSGKNKSILEMFSPKNQPTSQLQLGGKPNRSYLQNIRKMKSQKYLNRDDDLLKEYISISKNPSFQNILKSPKISNIEKCSVQRLNLKRNKLRMALNY